MKEVNCKERIKVKRRVSLKLVSINIKRQIRKRNQKKESKKESFIDLRNAIVVLEQVPGVFLVLYSFSRDRCFFTELFFFTDTLSSCNLCY